MSAAEDDRHGSYLAVLDGRVIGRASIEQKKFPTGLCNDNEQETILVTLRHKHDRLEIRTPAETDPPSSETWKLAVHLNLKGQSLERTNS